MENVTVSQMIELNKQIPSIKSKNELKLFAYAKAKLLQPNTEIRLTNLEQSYTLLSMGGYIFIGSYYKDFVNEKFNSNPVMILSDKYGKAIGEFQKL